jgi:mRNA-degrading endonuclease HigB of HigAB toxin-antitoxin module
VKRRKLIGLLQTGRRIRKVRTPQGIRLSKLARLVGYENINQGVNRLTSLNPRESSPSRDNKFVFKRLKGTDYRLVIKVNYKFQKVFIRFIGTHSQYDRIDANTV